VSARNQRNQSDNGRRRGGRVEWQDDDAHDEHAPGTPRAWAGDEMLLNTSLVSLFAERTHFSSLVSLMSLAHFRGV
jgi:hypothetical protein